ncbi:MAG TPA: hypothetical protein VFQ65_07510 [Kofleriaceae bacterium]|nr:hypothetical protein [Kofleriaceae bacterium]
MQSIDFRAGSSQDVIAGTTFGLLSSRDGGATWHWYCDAAIGFAGPYDPDYAYTSTGSIFATTFNGLNVSRDACTFNSGALGTTFVSTDELGSNGALHVGAADPTDAKIHTSLDDGTTFPVSAAPGIANDWWDSLRVAPSDPQRLYLSGYRFTKQCNAASTNAGTACMMDTDCPGGACNSVRVFLLNTSADDGTSFVPMTTTGIATSSNSVIDIVGVDPAMPTVVYAEVSLPMLSGGYDLYRSDDAGVSWTKILASNDAFGLAFVARHDGDIVAATTQSGSQVSHDRGATWMPLACAPRIHCLHETPTGQLWACTNNFTEPGQPSDGFAIMKTTDLVTWSGVLNLQAVLGPVDCAAGTVQHDTCAPMWATIATQLGSGDATPIPTCPIVVGDDSITALPDAGDVVTPPTAPSGGGGCCSASGGHGTFVLAAFVLFVLGRSRRASAA